ncbi:MAG: nucleotidyltransferase [bacterium]
MEKTLKEIISILEKAKLNLYALIGGLAVGGWVTPRATKDIDILLILSEINQEVVEKGILKLLAEEGFESSFNIGDIEDEIRFCIKSISKDGIPVDMIIATQKWERDIVEQSLIVEVLKGVSVPVVKPEGLIVLKLKAGSFQDIADASKLLMEAPYDYKRLLALAKRARVDKRLARLMERLRL